MLIKLTDIVSDGLHGLILCTFFFITEAEIDASGLDGLGKGILHPARKPDRGRDSGNAGENICLTGGPEGKKVPPGNNRPESPEALRKERSGVSAPAGDL